MKLFGNGKSTRADDNGRLALICYAALSLATFGVVIAGLALGWWSTLFVP